jgi:hypothetical protein
LNGHDVDGRALKVNEAQERTGGGGGGGGVVVDRAVRSAGNSCLD